MMTARKLSAIAASTALAGASVYSINLESRRLREEKIQKAANKLVDSQSDSVVIDRSIHSTDQDTAERILDATGKEIRWSIRNFNEAAGSTLTDTKVKAMVAARFLDVLTRSASAMLEYKFHGMFDKDKDLHKVHARHAKSLHEACTTHGGLLVKLGQYIATTSGGFIPTEYVEALKPLQDECAPLEIDQVLKCIEKELRTIYPNQSHHKGPLWELVFDDIEFVPLGSASLAQVHAATLKDGTKVALKVQRPNLDASTKADMAALSLLSRAIERAFPGAGFDWMLPEFHKTIIAELDFTQEARNAERAKRMLKGVPLSTNISLLQTLVYTITGSTPKPPETIVPNTFSHLTTSKMLTMSFEEGFRITDKARLAEHGISTKMVAAAACSLFAELMMVHGFVYADAHPGNIFIRPRFTKGEFDIVLLDHGMYRRLDETFRSSYCNLWAGLVNGNDQQAMKGISGLGLPDNYLDLMGLMLTYRIPSSLVGYDSPLGNVKLGTAMGKSAREAMMKHLKEKYGGDAFSPSAFNKFMEGQSRDLLFCLRCSNLVRGMNLELGGSTLDRFIAFGSAASRGSNLVMPLTYNESEVMTSTPNDTLVAAKASLNRPVASELIADGRANTSKYAFGRNDIMLPRTFADSIETYKMSVRTWWRGFLIDFFVLITGRSVDFSSRKFG